MNYDAAKNYGALVNDIASALASSEDIYKAATSIKCDNLEHYVLARLALTELMAYYTIEKDIVSFVIDEYIVTDKVDEVFFTKVDRSPQAKIEFIRRNLGNQHTLLCHIQLLLHTLTILSHPERFGADQLQIALDNVVKPLTESTAANNAVFSFCFESMKQKARQEDKINQRRYEIGNEKLMSEIYQYLRTTDVLDDEVSLPLFINSIIKADVSNIHPKLQEHFRCTLTHIQHCIRVNKKQWLRDVCRSINKTPQEASKNGTNLKDWYENLCDLVEKGRKK